MHASAPFPIIDLFAGPGGLGEGFSSLLRDDGTRQFKIGLSIEKDVFAHRTLELRAFFREFAPGQAHEDYYQYLAGRIDRETLFSRHPKAAVQAMSEAWHAELGSAQTPDSMVDARILSALKGAKSWVLIGGPPCQAYSLVGRSRVIGGEGREKYDQDPRHELYRHYLRILAVHQPPVFVMENVKGLLSAKVKEERIFERILGDLRNPLKALPGIGAALTDETFGYNLVPLATHSGDLLGDVHPEDFLVRAEEHGIPQARHRLIILGIRADLGKSHERLSGAPSVPIEQVIGDLPKLRSGLSKENDSPESWQAAVRELAEDLWGSGFYPDIAILEAIERALTKVGTKLGRGALYQEGATKPETYSSWYTDPKLGGICNHETRGHIKQDLHRYFFATVFARKHGHSPLLEEYPKRLLPNHDNVGAALKDNKFNDRFRVQLKGRPSTTVVSHISKDGHYFIHYDPSQCRSLTVREAARLQTFPDNYFFEGPRTEQYKQVGNAVPPLLAKQIASIVAKLLR